MTPHQGAHSAPVGHNSNNNNSIPTVPHSTQPRRSYSGKRHSSARRSLQFREARLLHGALHVHVVTDAAAVQSSTLFSTTAAQRNAVVVSPADAAALGLLPGDPLLLRAAPVAPAASQLPEDFPVCAVGSLWPSGRQSQGTVRLGSHVLPAVLEAVAASTGGAASTNNDTTGATLASPVKRGKPYVWLQPAGDRSRIHRAATVTVVPITATAAALPQALVAATLQGRVLVDGSRIELRANGAPVQCAVQCTGAQLFQVTRDTTLVVGTAATRNGKQGQSGAAASAPSSGDARAFASVGGLQAQVLEIQSILDLPIRHPDLFSKFGVKPSRGILMYVCCCCCCGYVTWLMCHTLWAGMGLLALARR